MWEQVQDALAGNPIAPPGHDPHEPAKVDRLAVKAPRPGSKNERCIQLWNEGLTEDEVADALGWQRGTVQSVVSKWRGHGYEVLTREENRRKRADG